IRQAARRGDRCEAAVGHPLDIGQDGEQVVVPLVAAVEVLLDRLPAVGGATLGEVVDVGAHERLPLSSSTSRPAQDTKGRKRLAGQTSGRPIRPEEGAAVSAVRGGSVRSRSTPTCSPVTTVPKRVNDVASSTWTRTVCPVSRSLPSKTTM